jgi:hypothetical protein
MLFNRSNYPSSKNGNFYNLMDLHEQQPVYLAKNDSVALL